MAIDWTKITGEVTDLVKALPGWVKAGIDVTDMYAAAKSARDQIGTSVGKTNAEYAALNALLAEFDAAFDAAVAKRLAG